MHSEHEKTKNPSQKLDPRRRKQFTAKSVQPQARHTKTHHRFASSPAHSRSIVLGTTKEGRHGVQFGKNSPKYGQETDERKANTTTQLIKRWYRFSSGRQRPIVKRLKAKRELPSEESPSIYRCPRGSFTGFNEPMII